MAQPAERALAATSAIEAAVIGSSTPPASSSDDPRTGVPERWLLVVATLILLVAGVAMFGLPQRTAALLGWTGAGSEAGGLQWVIPAGREEAIRSLIVTAARESSLAQAGLIVTGVQVERERMVLTVARGPDAADLTAPTRIILSHAGGALEHKMVATVSPARAAIQQPSVAAFAEALGRGNADTIWSQLRIQRANSTPGLSEAFFGRPEMLVLPYWHGAVCVLALVTTALALRRRRAFTAQREIKLTHALPATLQAVLFAYWFLHWPEGRHLIPLIGLQLVYAYVLDFLFASAAGLTWRVGFGPVPVVFSTNLFAQFSGTQVWCALLAVAVALASKAFFRRGRRHIFNPSVVGLCFVAIIDLFSPGIDTPDFAHEFHAPPNMTELILVLSLIVQFRLPVVLVTLAAALGILATGRIVPDPAFYPTWAAVTLVLCLLITDPATIPRRPLGRVLFGAFIGSGMVVGHNILMVLGHTDFWAKVLIVPIANALVPSFDTIAGRVPRVTPLDDRFRPAHVALWCAFAVALLVRGKSTTFAVAYPEAYSSACYNRTGDRNDCVDNEMYCTPFSVAAEIDCWRRHLERGQRPSPSHESSAPAPARSDRSPRV